MQIYNASEALPNLVNPFWMLPLLGILKLKASDIVGYGVLQMLVHIPIVFFLCWFFARPFPTFHRFTKMGGSAGCPTFGALLLRG